MHIRRLVVRGVDRMSWGCSRVEAVRWSQTHSSNVLHIGPHAYVDSLASLVTRRGRMRVSITFDMMCREGEAYK